LGPESVAIRYHGVGVFHVASSGTAYAKGVATSSPHDLRRPDETRVRARYAIGADGGRSVPYFAFVCDPHRSTVSCVQPQGHHRFEFMLAPGRRRRG
jgi:hypothetical protein